MMRMDFTDLQYDYNYDELIIDNAGHIKVLTLTDSETYFQSKIWEINLDFTREFIIPYLESLGFHIEYTPHYIDVYMVCPTVFTNDNNTEVTRAELSQQIDFLVGLFSYPDIIDNCNLDSEWGNFKQDLIYAGIAEFIERNIIIGDNIDLLKSQIYALYEAYYIEDYLEYNPFIDAWTIGHILEEYEQYSFSSFQKNHLEAKITMQIVLNDKKKLEKIII